MLRRQWLGSILFQVMACRLFVTNQSGLLQWNKYSKNYFNSFGNVICSKMAEAILIWLQSLKRKCRHFDEIFITGCTGSCHFDNFQCGQWWKFRQNYTIFVSVNVLRTSETRPRDVGDFSECICLRMCKMWYSSLRNGWVDGLDFCTPMPTAAAQCW